jgi:GNAT superfamily N-acetyltransferase
MIIRDMDKNDMEKVLATVVSAFFDERLYKWTVPIDTERSDFIRIFFQYRLEKEYGKKFIKVAEDKDGSITGAAIWSPPAPGEAGGNSAVFRQVFADYDSGISDRCIHFIDTVLEALEFFHQPLWELGPLFVRKETRGKGIGSLLIRDHLKEIDDKGIPCVLVTQEEKNIRIYERFGFKTAITVPIDEKAGLASYGMIREKGSM